MEGVMPGGSFARPVRHGDRVVREVAAGGANVHALLQHFEAKGFAYAPNGWYSHEAALPAEIDCVGHRDLGPWNLVYQGTEVTGVIDRDFAGPTSRAWDLAYAAHHFVPFHPDGDMAAWGWADEPDRARRLRILAEAYGDQVSPAELVDLAIVRMTAIAAHIEARIRCGDPAFEPHRVDGHASGYRRAAAHIIGARSRLPAG